MAWDRLSPVASSALASSPPRSNFQALDESNWGPNWIMDPYFLIWPLGDAVIPAHYDALVGSGLAVARDTTNHQSNGMACKLTLGSADGYLPQTIFASGDMPTYLKGSDFSFGCFIKTSTALLAKMGINDGVGTSYTTIHTGGGGWEWVVGTRTLSASATLLEVRLQVDIAGSSGNATFDLPVLIPGPVPPQKFIPCPVSEGTIFLPIVGTVEVDEFRMVFSPSRPLLIRNVSLSIITAPTDASLIADIEHWDGSTWQTMFSTKPTILTTATIGGANPDGTYRYRCFTGRSDLVSITDAQMALGIEQVGSTEPGVDLSMHVRVLQFQRPWSALAAF